MDFPSTFDAFRSKNQNERISASEDLPLEDTPLGTPKFSVHMPVFISEGSKSDRKVNFFLSEPSNSHQSEHGLFTLSSDEEDYDHSR